MIDRRTLSVLFTIILVAGVIMLLYAARHTVISIIFGIFLAYILEPIVGMMQKWLGSRNRGVAATYVGLLICFGLLALTAGPHVVHEVRRLNERLPALLETIGSGQIAQTVADEHQWSDGTRTYLQQFLAGHRDDIIRLVSVMRQRIGILLENIAWIVLVPVLSVFFLLGKASLSAKFLNLINASHERRIWRNVISDLDTMLAQYIRAQVLLSLLAAIAYTVFLLIIRLPYAFAIGPIAGILEFLPLVGPLLAGLSILAIAFTTGFGHALPIIGFWLVWRGVQDYYNMPHLMRREMELPPLLAVTTVLAGGEVAGILGMFLSIPAVGVIRVIWKNTVERRRIDREKKERAA